MSDYISKSEVIEILIDIDWNDGTLTEAISKLADIPTLSETEIIRNAFDRVLQRLEESTCYVEDGDGHAGHFVFTDDAIEIVKEECGINE